MAQYIQLVSNTTASTPVDVWTPASNNVKPQIADQYAAGYFKNLQDNTYEFSTEVYYKKIQHIVDYIDAADLILNPYIEGDLLEGDGRAYGAEFLLKKNKGALTGWLSYTLAKTERKTPGINQNNWYPSRYDQTHKFNLTSFYDINERWSISSTFTLISGTPITFPTSRFEQQGYVIPHNGNDTRNNVRIPIYHRLDLGATLKGKQKEGKKWYGEWVFSIYNVYNRRNPFAIFFQPEDGRPSSVDPIKTEAIKLSVIGNFIPSVSYNFKFN
jgi:hypothetical protein